MSNLKCLFLTALSFYSTIVFANKETINVYTYDSFVSEWGAGATLKTQFEQQNSQCQINFVPLADSLTLFNRVRLEGNKTKADIVLGLDNFTLEDAHKSGIFAPHQVDYQQLSLPIEWKDRTFLPYDFGQYAFIYDKMKLTNPPTSLKELVSRQDLKVIYQDPRTSSVGRGLLLWMNSIYGENDIAQAWLALNKHTVTVAKGWSETYGAFLKGESDLVLSYNTSPLYHILNEQQENYVATDFAEGGVLQIEVAAKTNVHHKACSDQFLAFLLQPNAQQAIAKANTMLPVINTKIEPHFDALKAQQLQRKTLDTSEVTSEKIKQWVWTWQNALAQ